MSPETLAWCLSGAPQSQPACLDQPISNSHSLEPRLQLSGQAMSIRTVASSDPRYEVTWDNERDLANPLNWSLSYRALIIGLLSFSTWVVTLYSSIYTTAIPGMVEDFHVSEMVAISGLMTYLFGLGAGSVVLAPVSEICGRRPVYVGSMFVFMALVLPSALATSMTEILVVRFFCAFAGAAMLANAPGTLSDIVTDEHRALAYSLWSFGPFNGPVLGPVIGGFVSQYLGWRWTNWLVLVFAAAAFISVTVIDETYAPTILRKKAARRRKEMVEMGWWSRYDRCLSLGPLVKVNLSRPFVMAITEPICLFWDIYIAVVYGILYLCFVAYPVVFSDIRGWAPGVSGLAFLGIGVGNVLAIILEPLLRQVINAHDSDPETGKAPPEAMVSIVCVAAVLTPVGILWFAWTCIPATVHWIWPILAGVPWGAGNTLTFIYASNYLAHSYGIYSASAMAGNAVVRSVLGGTLPLAGAAMYRDLDPRWAGTLLGLLTVVLVPIPFVFYSYGGNIRKRSSLIHSMQEDKKHSSRSSMPRSAVGYSYLQANYQHPWW